MLARYPTWFASHLGLKLPYVPFVSFYSFICFDIGGVR